MISADRALRYMMGIWVLAALATIFFCIVVTPILIVIGFAGKFWSMWEFVASRPFLTGFGLVAFMALVMIWIWLMLMIGSALMRQRSSY